MIDRLAIIAVMVLLTLLSFRVSFLAGDLTRVAAANRAMRAEIDSLSASAGCDDLVIRSPFLLVRPYGAERARLTP